VSVPLTTYQGSAAVGGRDQGRDSRAAHAALGRGERLRHFANDMSLTGREISLILSWADGGAPSGVLLVDEDKQPVFIPPLTGWDKARRTHVVKVASDKKIGPDAAYSIERFDVTTALKQPAWLRALQLNPSDRRGIRYAAIYDARNGRWLGTWTPSSRVSAMPAGSGVQLPAAAKLTVEIGFKGNLEAGEVSGASDLGLYYFEKAPAQTAQAIDLTAAAAVNVAPGKIGERMRVETAIKNATTIAAIFPRLGAGARSVEVTAIRPDGSVEPMPVGEQRPPRVAGAYIMKEAMTLPAGTRLVMTAYYDNKTDAAIAAKPSLRLLRCTVSPERNHSNRKRNRRTDSLVRWNCSQIL
jgi:hypothetical protein